RHADRSLPDDRPGDGDRWDDGRQEEGGTRAGHVPDHRAALHRPAGERDRDRRSADLLPGPLARPDRRALRRGAGGGLLMKPATVSLANPQLVGQALRESVTRLSPLYVWRSPVMFVVEIGSVVTTALFLRDLIRPSAAMPPLWFTGGVSLWLWFT